MRYKRASAPLQLPDVKITREHNRKHSNKRDLNPRTLEAAGYFFVYNTLGPTFTAAQVVKIYAGRWQVELAFKRLKSLLRVGHLHKTNPEAAKAWLHGKILVAFLVTAMIAAGKSFSPWGYRLPCQNKNQSFYLERDLIDV